MFKEIVFWDILKSIYLYVGIYLFPQEVFQKFIFMKARIEVYEIYVATHCSFINFLLIKAFVKHFV